MKELEELKTAVDSLKVRPEQPDQFLHKARSVSQDCLDQADEDQAVER